MQINVFAIAKGNGFKDEIEGFVRALRSFNINLELFIALPPDVKRAQSIGANAAKKASEMYFSKKLTKNSYILSEHGRLHTSKDFAARVLAPALESKEALCFFIAGAYGLSEEFIRGQKSLSLSSLTFSHDIARLVLAEQIYRGACIINSHPYHKV